MLYSRSGNIKINKLFKGALRRVYDDYNSKFEELLTKDGSFTIPPKNSDIGNRNVQNSPWIFTSIFSGFVS